MKRLYKWLQKNYFIFLLFIVVFLAYGKTIQMYFWVDDWGAVHKMLFPKYDPPDSNFGAGIFGEGAYRYNTTPFTLLYPIFGLSSTAYYLLGFLQYFGLSLLVYFFVKDLTKKRINAQIASLIFASGYIGSYAVYRMSNSYQLIQTAVFIIITAGALYRYFLSGKRLYYYLSLILFILSLELYFLRAHGIIFVVLAISFLFSKGKKTLSWFINFILIQAPFILVYYYFYFIDYTGGSESNWQASSGFLSQVKQLFLEEKRFGEIKNLLITVVRMLVPDQIISTIYNSLIKLDTSLSSYLTDNTVTLIVAGIFTAILIRIYTKYQTKNVSVNLIILGLTWIFGNVFIYFIYLPTSSLASNSRYVIPAFVGSVLVYSGSISLITKNKIRKVLVGLICFIFIYLSNKEQDIILKYVSIPDKEGYKMIEREVPRMDKNTLFYVGTIDDPNYRGKELAGVPQVGISAVLGYRGKANIAESYDELLYWFSKTKDFDNVYTFFLSGDGYKNTTNTFRNLARNSHGKQNLVWQSLTPETTTLIVKNELGTLAVNPTVLAEFDYPSLMPSVLTLNMTITPINQDEYRYPLFDVSSMFKDQQIDVKRLEKVSQPLIKNSPNEVVSSLKIEKERQDFVNNARISTSSNWSGKWAELLKDGTNALGWEANYDSWKYKENYPEEIVIDLGKEQEVGKLIWVNHYYLATPKKYTISTSRDSVNWTEVVITDNGPDRESLEIVVEDISTSARYIKMSIFETKGGKGHVPAIDEMWITKLADDFSLNTISEIIDCPFCFVPDRKTNQLIFDVEKEIAQARVWWLTNKRNNYYLDYSREFPIFLDGKPHTYTIYLPAQGTIFKGLKIDGFKAPVEIAIKNMSIRSLSLDELEKEGLIKDFDPEDVRSLLTQP